MFLSQAWKQERICTASYVLQRSSREWTFLSTSYCSRAQFCPSTFFSLWSHCTTCDLCSELHCQVALVVNVCDCLLQVVIAPLPLTQEGAKPAMFIVLICVYSNTWFFAFKEQLWYKKVFFICERSQAFSE